MLSPPSFPSLHPLPLSFLHAFYPSLSLLQLYLLSLSPSLSPQSEQAAYPADSRVTHLLPCPATVAEFLRHPHQSQTGPGHRPKTLLAARGVSQRPLHCSLCLHQEWPGVLSWTAQGFFYCIQTSWEACCSVLFLFREKHCFAISVSILLCNSTYCFHGVYLLYLQYMSGELISSIAVSKLFQDTDFLML